MIFIVKTCAGSRILYLARPGSIDDIVGTANKESCSGNF